VHVEERQGVSQHVVPGPLPRRGEGVEVRGDRAHRQHRPLGLPGGARRVDHERRVLLVALGSRQLAAAPLHVDPLEPRRLLELGQRVGGRAEQHFGPAVGEHVRELAHAELRVDRHERDARRARGHDCHAGLEAGLRPDADALGPPHAGGGRGRRLAQLAVAQAAAANRDGGLVTELVKRRKHPSSHRD
jgi:hypothetical protein